MMSNSLIGVTGIAAVTVLWCMTPLYMQSETQGLSESLGSRNSSIVWEWNVEDAKQPCLNIPNLAVMNAIECFRILEAGANAELSAKSSHHLAVLEVQCSCLCLQDFIVFVYWNGALLGRRSIRDLDRFEIDPMHYSSINEVVFAFNATNAPRRSSCCTITGMKLVRPGSQHEIERLSTPQLSPTDDLFPQRAGNSTKDSDNAPLSSRTLDIRRSQSALAGTRLLAGSSLNHSSAFQPVLLHCRITALETMFEPDQTKLLGTFSQEDFGCIPIRYSDGKESDMLHPLVGGLPSFIQGKHRKRARRGMLVAAIQGTILQNGSMIVPRDKSGQFQILKKEPKHWPRRLTTMANGLGTRTLAIVRVSTADATPYVTLQELAKHFVGPGRSAATQYALCSFKKFQIKYNGGYEVKLKQSIHAFESGGQLLNAAQTKLVKDMKLESAADLADKVIFCLAPGTKGWIANAGVNYWKVSVNSAWCLSLSVGMHELVSSGVSEGGYRILRCLTTRIQGHTIGLVHSGAGEQAYGDETGYMGYGDKAVEVR